MKRIGTLTFLLSLLAIPFALAQTVSFFSVRGVKYEPQNPANVPAGVKTYVRLSDSHFIYNDGTTNQDISAAVLGTTLLTAYGTMPASAPAALPLDSTRKWWEWTPYGGQTTEPLVAFRRDGILASANEN